MVVFFVEIEWKLNDKKKILYFYWLIEVSIKRGLENSWNNALPVFMQFSILIWLIPRSTENI